MGTRTTSRARYPIVSDGRSPLWRAHNAWRALTLLYALTWFCVERGRYDHPHLAELVMAVMVLWTVFTIWRYSSKAGRTHRLVLLDQVLCTVLFLSSGFILSDAQLTTIGNPSLVTIWHASAVTAAAVHWGMFGGGAAASLAAVCDFLLRQFNGPSMWLDAVLLLGTGLLLGLAADTARRSTERLTRALQAEAATAERERLARSIHDGVLQVLSRVRYRGSELGGEAAEIAKLAGEQEIALRALIATEPAEPNDSGNIDLAAQLQMLRSGKVEVSVPATAVELTESLTAALHSVARETLENVERHAGADAKAWVLLEDVDGEIVLSIRDNGPGIPEGRLDEAVAEGRMGVAQSIRGRIEKLGGTIALDTAPDEGTEWEIRVGHPVSAPRDGGSEGRKLGGWRLSSWKLGRWKLGRWRLGRWKLGSSNHGNDERDGRAQSRRLGGGAR